YPDTIRAFRPSWISKDTTVFVRAALVRNDGFLTALGRPNRENVLTSRSSQASLLQALELTNGERFNNALEHGAREWLARHASGAEIVRNVYTNALRRQPTEDEVVT